MHGVSELNRCGVTEPDGTLCPECFPKRSLCVAGSVFTRFGMTLEGGKERERRGSGMMTLLDVLVLGKNGSRCCETFLLPEPSAEQSAGSCRSAVTSQQLYPSSGLSRRSPARSIEVNGTPSLPGRLKEASCYSSRTGHTMVDDRS